MYVTLRDQFVRQFVTEKELEAMRPEIAQAHEKIVKKNGAGSDFLGWKELPQAYDREEFARIAECAAYIRSHCDVFIAIGIGGSYLGARAVIEFLRSPYHNELRKDGPAIYFAGNSISASGLCELVKLCEGKDVCINVISKSGTTTEPAVAFRVFHKMLVDKYGEEEARRRIFVTTDKARGTLKQFADKKGYQTFVVPDDVGGRYSVLTPVGLLPIAVAGIDIKALMEGAACAMKELSSPDIDKNGAYRYAAIRNALYRKGKVNEILVSYEPYGQLFNEWWKQLFGESEGKDGKGIFPVSVVFSTDLHSLGQYIQQGERIMFETVLNVKDGENRFLIPNDPNNIDGLNFLSGMDLNDVKVTAMNGTLLAHTDGQVPNIVLDVSERSERSLGYLIYFFELACAVSGYVLGVNPFDQPGVEAYKKNMFALLGKPGYEEQQKELQKRIK
ncbi:MAG: glucose-6-phosphate isomerase [Clostridia bacterium]|nr:glucose-6-phosphate isomerase [Clostridia bacterium]